MNDLLIQLALYVASFIVVWWGSGLVVSSISHMAYGIKLPAFTISFFILGMLTSLPELSIGLTAISNEDPSIFVGNLIGGVLVLFLLVIPLMGLAGKGVLVPKQVSHSLLSALLVVCFLPTFLVRDRTISTLDGLIALGAYFFLFLLFSKQQGLLERVKNNFKAKRKIKLWDVVKVIVGICLLVVGSNQIVESTQYFAVVLDIAPFFVSLIIVSLGTNVPEIALLFRSVMQKKTEVALADYLGSASANTLLFGVLSLGYQKTITIPNHYLHRYLFMMIGLLLVYVFMRSKNKLSKIECFVLLLFYIAFIVVELSLV